jgi:protein-S-isoprenylcysteine O-methyltransferase Ste14
LALIKSAAVRAAGRMRRPPGGLLVHILDHRTNSFAAPVVKIQKDRSQEVITTGPYAIVRHPMYFGTLFYIAGTSLVLGS